MPKGDYLGEFEQFVLLALIRLGRDAYGMMVRRELESTARRRVTIGSVYGTLERLEEKGYVTSWHGEPEAVRGGRSRRFFRIEPEGERALADARAMMERMWDGVTVSPRRTR